MKQLTKRCIKKLLNGTGHTGSLTLSFQTGERSEDTITATIDAVNISELFFGSDTVFPAGSAYGTITLPLDFTALGACRRCINCRWSNLCFRSHNKLAGHL